MLVVALLSAPADLGVPAYATSTTGSPAATSHASRSGLRVLADGNTTTITVDLGQPYDAPTMQAALDELQGGGGNLSDQLRRMLGEAVPQPPNGGSTNDFLPQTNAVSFDGTITEASSHTGLVVAIPSGEVQANTTWWQSVIAAVVGVTSGLLVRGLCVAGFALSAPVAIGVAAKTVCATVGAFTGTLVGGFIRQAFDGTLGSAKEWSNTFIAAIFAAAGGAIWEGGLNKWVDESLPGVLTAVGDFIQRYSQYAWSGIQAGLQRAAAWVRDFAAAVPDAVRSVTARGAASALSCDQYAAAGTPCGAAHSMVRALYGAYDGPLYQVQRLSDGRFSNVGTTSPGGYADASQQDTFCANTSCTVSKIYDQSPWWNDLTVEGAGGAGGADHAANAASLPITIAGRKAYGLAVTGQVGYRDDHTTAVAIAGQPEAMYMVASGVYVNNGCCFDYGNAETNNQDTGNGHMDAVNLGTECYFAPCSGKGPWVEADMENGLFSGGNGSDLDNKGNSTAFVTALLKNDGQTKYALKGGNSQSGPLTTWYSGALPSAPGYRPMHQEGAIVLGTGGDNSNWSVGSFFEGVMTTGYPSDAADDAVQGGIVAAGLSGSTVPIGATIPPNPNAGSDPVPGYSDTTSGAAVVHAGFTSVYTVDAANGHLQESYLTAMGQPWQTQDLSAKYGTPAVLPGTRPVAITHAGFTSVYTVDAASGHLQETYLTAIGQPWTSQDLSAKYGTSSTRTTPTAVVHDGFTSVYTVDTTNADLQETYLTAIGQPWTSQDLSAKYGTPQVQAGTAPTSVVHGGFTSVYTVTTAGHLEETYLTRIGAAWVPQDLTQRYYTPLTRTTPVALTHGGYTSVFTVNDADRHLQETYLPSIGQPWTSQDFSGKYGTPPVAPGTTPLVAVHSGFASVFTTDQGSDHLQETYLPAIGNAWSSHDLSSIGGTPPTTATPVAVVLHPDASGNLSWTSVYTTVQGSEHLQETNLAKIGDPWWSQDLTAKYGTPPVYDTPAPTASEAVVHGGFTSVFTVDTNLHLQETYLPAMGQAWQTQDLTAKYGTPPVLANTHPVAIVHGGFVSVYTVDSGSRHLQETYLTAIGQSWTTQDLSSKYGTPTAWGTPTAVLHDGFTSVYTDDWPNGDLQETYLPAIGQDWRTQDLSQNYGVPAQASGFSPVSTVHDGWVSVFTVDGANNHLQESFLPAIGLNWSTHDLSALAGTPSTSIEPTIVVHDGFTSAFTRDASNGHLDETYLSAISDPWTEQDLTSKYGTPPVANLAQPLTSLYHAGFTSVYTRNASNGHLEETYLPAISAPWTAQDLSANYGAASPDTAGTALLHQDAATGFTWTSVFTADASNGDLIEDYLPAVGQPWLQHDLTRMAGTPPQQRIN